MLRAGIRVTQISAWERLESIFVLLLYVSGLFQRWVSTDSIFISLHVLLARRPACRLRVCLGCYSQSANYQPTTFWQAAVGVIGQQATQRYPKLTNCFCAIAQIHAFYYVLHTLGQYQTNGLLLWDRPISCLLSCFTRTGAIPE